MAYIDITTDFLADEECMGFLIDSGIKLWNRREVSESVARFDISGDMVPETENKVTIYLTQEEGVVRIQNIEVVDEDLPCLIRGEKATSEQIITEWRAINDQKGQAFRKTLAHVNALFSDWEQMALENLSSQTRSVKPSVVSVDQILTKAQARAAVTPRMRPVIQQVLEIGFARGTLNATGSLGDINFNDPMTRKIVMMILGKTKGIGDTTHRQLGARLRQAMGDGATTGELREVVRDYFTDASEHRLTAIAQTVSTTSYESGQQQAFIKAGIKFKKWVSVRDGRVRTAHWNADGQVVSISGSFQVGTTKMKYPGDPEAPAHQVVNCRCSMLPQKSKE